MAFVSRIGAWRLLVLAVGVAATACSLLLDTDQFVGRETASALDAGGSESGLEASVIDADSGSADSGPTYRDEVLADNPLAYYRLGETSGTVALDETGHGHTGTPVAVACRRSSCARSEIAPRAAVHSEASVRRRLGFRWLE